MNVQPLEFIDFSKFNFIPGKANRQVEDPLALEIKEEPLIKEEPIDTDYLETQSNQVDCKKEPLDENEGLKDPLAFSPCSSPVEGDIPATVNSYLLPLIKEEPPDPDASPSIPSSPVALNLNVEDDGECIDVSDCWTSQHPEVTVTRVGGPAASEDWLLNSDCGRILSKDLPNIVAFSNNIAGQLTKRVRGRSQVVRGLKKALKKSSVIQKPSGRTNFYCFHCSHVAYQKSHIRSHIVAIHGGVKPYSCHDCNLRFVQKGGLNRHILVVHNREKPFKCDRCDFSCGRKEGLRNHKASMHDHLRPHACSECSFTAVRKNHLVSHVKIVHQKVKPFTCNLCSYASGRKIHLQNHINHKHNNIKHFSCTNCFYKTNQKSNLKQHVNAVHNKLKPFVCHHCDHRTNHKGSLRGHIIAFHLSGKSHFGCFYCTFASHYKNSLSRHIQKMHSDACT